MSLDLHTQLFNLISYVVLNGSLDECIYYMGLINEAWV